MGAVDAVNAVGLPAEHTHTSTHAHIRTHARTYTEAVTDRERALIGEPFESLGGLLCDAVMQFGWCHGLERLGLAPLGDVAQRETLAA